MTFDINKADIVDTTRVDNALASIRRNEENARRRATLLTWGKAVLLGGIGVAAVIAAASLWLMHPRVIETTKVVEKPVIIEKPVIVEREAKSKPPVEAPLPPVKLVEPPKVDVPVKPKEPCIRLTDAKADYDCPVVGHKEPPPPPVPAPTTETHPWDKLADKQYVGILTDVNDGKVCVDHDTAEHHCIQDVEVDEQHHAKLDPDGHAVPSSEVDLSPMVKWIGYSIYKADNPADPKHLADYWIADHGELIHFESAPLRGKADVVMLRSDGQSLLLDVGLGAPPDEKVRTFILDTGASTMTVTSAMAAELVGSGHAEPGKAETVTYADGRPRPVQTLTIDTVRVGTHVLRDVHASVMPAGSPMLLGLDVLNAIGRFEVDAPHRTLTFNGGAT
jgi:clan AA aspartic protease (TIGR02281 family)